MCDTRVLSGKEYEETLVLETSRETLFKETRLIPTLTKSRTEVITTWVPNDNVPPGTTLLTRDRLSVFLTDDFWGSISAQCATDVTTFPSVRAPLHQPLVAGYLNCRWNSPVSQVGGG